MVQETKSMTFTVEIEIPEHCSATPGHLRTRIQEQIEKIWSINVFRCKVTVKPIRRRKKSET